jgi:phytoene synthase
MSPTEPVSPKALPAGSLLWWGLLFTTAERQPGARALLAVRGEIVETARHASDPSIAAAKLGWWRDEARRFGSGGEQHSSTRALAAADGSDVIEPEYLEELVDGACMDAAHRPYGSFSELRLYCHRSSGVLQEMLATLVGVSDPRHERAVRQAAHRVGIGVRLAEIACGLQADLAAGRLYLPGDWLEDAGVADGDITLGAPSDALIVCLERLAATAGQELDGGLAKLPPAERKRHRATAALAALALRRLGTARSRRWSPQPAGGRIPAAAASLGDLMTAWRAARRAARTRTETR